MNELTLFHEGTRLDSRSVYIQPLPIDITHAHRTKNIEEEEKSKCTQNIYEIRIK